MQIQILTLIFVTIAACLCENATGALQEKSWVNMIYDKMVDYTAMNGLSYFFQQ